MSKQVIPIGEVFEWSNQSEENIIVALTKPYTTLEEFYPTVPKVNNARIEDGYVVIELSDPSQWQLIADISEREQLPTLQILWWLGEMTKLWPKLEKVNCCESLLKESNLRLDEDQSFCLEQLIADPTDNPPTLKDLGGIWQQLFQSSEDECLGKLFARMCEGEIETVEQVEDELKKITEKEQSQSMSDLDDPEMDMDDLEMDMDDPEMDMDDPEMDMDDPEMDMDDPEMDMDDPEMDMDDPEMDMDDPEMDMDDPEDRMVYASPDDDMPTIVLPMQLLSLTDAGFTDIGLQRNHNEDSFGITTEVKKQENAQGKQIEARGLYIVCDGMGGHAAGEVASAMAVDTLQRYFQTHWQDSLPDAETIAEGILLANDKIYQTNLDNSRSGSGRMGTTLVMALIQNNKAAIANVGDSRIYKVTRKEGVEKLTVDHEVGQREIQRGVEPDVAYARPDAFQLTQALGPRDNELVHPDIDFLDLGEDSLLLLCSDGLSDNDLIENHGEEYLKPLISSSANLEDGLIKLVDFANEHNGHDNITGVIIKIKVRPNFDQQPLF